VRPYLEKKITKRAGRVPQVVKHLSSKCEVLSSSPNAAKKKKKRADPQSEWNCHFAIFVWQTMNIRIPTFEKQDLFIRRQTFCGNYNYLKES
jgi:hypothetical protein